MKKFYYIAFSYVLVLMVGCSDKKNLSDVLIYGNSFIYIDDTEFEPPADWKTHKFFYGAFQIQLPPYMFKTDSASLSEEFCSSSVFMYRDSLNDEEFHYARISIDYYYNPYVDYNMANEVLNIESQKEIMWPIVKRNIRGGKRIAGFVTKNDNIINGPFYRVLKLSKHRQFKVHDAFYRRAGHGDPVSCHLYLLMNKKECTMMMVSYHDRDSLIFKNLFNVVKTFKWRRLY